MLALASYQAKIMLIITRKLSSLLDVVAYPLLRIHSADEVLMYRSARLPTILGSAEQSRTFDCLQAPKPSPGPHKQRECLPLTLMLRNRLK